MRLITDAIAAVRNRTAALCCITVADERGLKSERHEKVSFVANKSSCGIGTSYGRVLAKLSRVASTALKTRIKFEPANLRSSSALHPRVPNKSNRSGYFETSSKPTGTL